MTEIVCVRLENEMDLILAHKRTMKLCELTGLSLITQTSIATAVSEISRCAIEYGRHAELRLSIEASPQQRFLQATIVDSMDFTSRCKDAIQYAERLVTSVQVVRQKSEVFIKLNHKLNTSVPLTEITLKSFVDYFRLEPPLSPYDELRRKNLLLQELAEKVQERENNFRILTDSLPLMMFSASRRGLVTYSNKWVTDYLGTQPKDLTPASWKSLLHPNEYTDFSRSLSDGFTKQVPVNGQYRLKAHDSGKYQWHMLSLFPLRNDKSEITLWIGFLVDIHADMVVGQTSKENRILKEIQQELFENQAQLRQKIIELNRSNYELEQFAHLASHDLQEPLRKMLFYSDALKRKYGSMLDEGAFSLMNHMNRSAMRMRELIKDLLSYSQLQQQTLQFEDVNLEHLLDDVATELDFSIRERAAVIERDTLPTITGNTLRLRQLFLNLISNALKYAKKDIAPHIQIRYAGQAENAVIVVRDNGIGFDNSYSEQIFGLFERLHTRDEFPGTGIGLSICRKITDLHHGTITATSKPGEFAEFTITLPVSQPVEAENYE